MKILITGAAGFIGSNFIRYMIKKYPNYNFINYDKLTYAGNLGCVKDLEEEPNYLFVKGDICDINFLTHLMKDVDCVVHFAAESHVDNSISYHIPTEDPAKRTLGNSLEFTRTNVYGTHALLEASKIRKIKKFIHISTDEVYGDIINGSFKESDKLSPNNPYSATKAAAEMITVGHYRSYKTPIIIVRGNNVYGPYQHPEKIIPRFITNILLNKKLPLHGDGSYIRTYIHVDDFCEALHNIFQNGVIGDTYNIGTNNEISNIKLAKILLKKMGKDENLIEFVTDRPFNDRRYSIDTEKISLLGWNQKITFQEGLDKTIEWYKKNKEWWDELIKAEENKPPSYQNYVK